MANDLRFDGKRVLVVGGTSGIGNATAQAFRKQGASVQVWGTRQAVADYDKSTDSDLGGLEYRRVDVSSFEQIRDVDLGFDKLDVLVLSQGIVLYERAEFQSDRFRHVVDVNLNSLTDCCMRFQPMLKESRRRELARSECNPSGWLGPSIARVVRPDQDYQRQAINRSRTPILTRPAQADWTRRRLIDHFVMGATLFGNGCQAIDIIG